MGSFKLDNFISYITIPLFKTRRRIEKLGSDEHRVLYSILTQLIVSLLFNFSFMYGTGGIFNFHSGFRYYKYRNYFIIPIFFIFPQIYISTVCLISYLFFNGRCNFRDVYSIWGTATFLPLLLTMWLPDTLVIVGQNYHYRSSFPGWGNNLKQILAIIWCTYVLSIGIRKYESLKNAESIIVAILGYIATGFFVVLFN